VRLAIRPINSHQGNAFNVFLAGAIIVERKMLSWPRSSSAVNQIAGSACLYAFIVSLSFVELINYNVNLVGTRLVNCASVAAITKHHVT